MALIECDECGKMISDSAEICPQCGYRKRTPFVQNIPIAQNRPNFQNRPKRVKPATKPLSSSEKLYFAFSGCYLLFVLILPICFLLQGIGPYQKEMLAIMPYTYSLVVFGLYLVCFTIATTKLTSISKIVALTFLSIGAICFLLCFVDQLSVITGWIQRISLTIVFVTFIIKCDGWNIKTASVFEIIIRIFSAALLIYTYNKEHNEIFYLVVGLITITRFVLEILSAIFFLIRIPEKQ